MGAPILLKVPTLGALLLVASSGCTTLSLERHTLAQAKTVSDVRYEETLQNLAMIADDPAALPVYSSIYAGTSQVTDTWQFGESTVWVRKKFMSSATNGFLTETASPLLSRSVTDNWSLDPILAPEKIEAMRCACRWVIYGPQRACAECPGLLASPEQDHSPGRHFGVADRLARLPRGWLRVGQRTDVPADACYQAHSGRTSVWVMPDGMDGLSTFTMILQDIARVNINSDSLYFWPPPPCVYGRVSGPLRPDGVGNAGPGKPEAAAQIPPVAAKDGRTLEVYVFTDGNSHLVPPAPYRTVRIENLGGDPSVRSYVSAAGGP
jgi:hypothetical protein